MIEEAKKELEKIEYQKRTWRSKFIREQCIWDEIAMQINSYTGEKKKYWCLVMDLYQEKYRQPTPQKEYKTFLIEVDWNGYTSREIVQFESMEIAERHYDNAISIIEVKLNIEPVNS